jgi:acyl carrier protein
MLENVLDEDFSAIEQMGSFEESDNWDSLNFVTLVVSLESEFHIKLQKEDIQKLLSVAGIKFVLNKHGVQGIES